MASTSLPRPESRAVHETRDIRTTGASATLSGAELSSCLSMTDAGSFRWKLSLKPPFLVCGAAAGVAVAPTPGGGSTGKALAT